MKAVISYPGAKWKFIEDMLPMFPEDIEYFIEPILGGASVTLSVAESTKFTKLHTMIAGELYSEMWALWTVVKTNPSAIIEIATQWMNTSCPHQAELFSSGFTAAQARNYIKGDYKNWEQDTNLSEEQKSEIREKLNLYNVAIAEAENIWNWLQSVDTNQMTLEQRAARMILSNKFSFSSMGDSGSLSKDQFTEFHLDKLNAVYDASKLLTRVEIMNVSFEETMKIGDAHPETAFTFLDPPYLNQETSGLYGKKGSTHKGFDHQHFADYTKQMHNKWFVTYDDSVGVRKLFSGDCATGKIFMKEYKTVYTMAGKTAEDALAGEELFISNYNLDENNCDFNDF